MARNVVLSNPDVLWKPRGLYMHVSRAGDTVYVAGQVGMRPGGDLAGSDVVTQTRQAFWNVQHAIESQGLSMSCVGKLNTYLIDASDLEPFFDVRAEIFAELFPDGMYPPNTLVVVDALADAALRVEVEAVAYAGR